MAHSLDELCGLVQRLAAARPVSSYGGGCSGHHAWIIVSDQGFDLEVYFGEDTRQDGVIDFVLHGPHSPLATSSWLTSTPRRRKILVGCCADCTTRR